MAATYNYSLIRVVPDRRRGEWVNIGVVVYLPERLDIRLLRNLSKLRVLAPDLDMGFIQSLESGWTRICANTMSVTERQALLERFPLVHASPLAMFLAGSAHQYRAQIDSIMRDLVQPPAAPRSNEARATRLELRIRDYFRKSDLLGSDDGDIDRNLVVYRYPIERASGLVADFALRNGALRLTQTIDFRVTPDRIRSEKRSQAALKAITFDRARAHTNIECIPSVIYAANDDTLDLVQPSLALLSDYADRIYDANNPSDMASYMTMMHEASMQH